MIRGVGLNNSAHVSDGWVFPGNLINDLRCPCCGSRFRIGFELQSSLDGMKEGVLRCDCYEYPVVRGIAVLRQIGPVSSIRNEAVECLKRHDSVGAYRWLLKHGSAAGISGKGLDGTSERAVGGVRFVRRLWNILRKSPPPPHGESIGFQVGFQAALQAVRPGGYADYLFHRFANPSLLGLIPPLVVFGNAFGQGSAVRVLDLLCGVGHASAILNALHPQTEIVTADSDFVNLSLAQQFVVPRGAAICVDAELPLPFGDSSFDGLLCLDGLHYIRSKVALLREVDRVINAKGVWLFAHMHNATVDNVNPGAPLTAGGYTTRFAFERQRLMPEREVLHQFQTGGFLDLTEQPDNRSLVSSHALTLLGARTETLWEKHAGLDDALCRRPDFIGFNPLYQVENVSDGLILRSDWPSESLRRECVEEIPILPETVQVSQHVVDEVVEMRTTGVLSDDVRKLLRSFVLVCLPECYPRKDLSA
jgi:SAM-dependent methyltransferase